MKISTPFGNLLVFPTKKNGIFYKKRRNWFLSKRARRITPADINLETAGITHLVMFDGKPGDLAATGVSLGVHRDDLPLWLEQLV
jgi:hypothetical protein